MSRSARHAAIQVDRRVAGLAQVVSLRRQLPAGRRDDAGRRDAALSRRPIGTGHHLAGPPTQDHEQHPSDEGSIVHPNVGRFPRVMNAICCHRQ